jgi:hypothetical protein
MRNRKRMNFHTQDSWKPSRELSAFVNLSKNILPMRRRCRLKAKMWRTGAEGFILRYVGERDDGAEKAKHAIARHGHRPNFLSAAMRARFIKSQKTCLSSGSLSCSIMRP